MSVDWDDKPYARPREGTERLNAPARRCLCDWQDAALAELMGRVKNRASLASALKLVAQLPRYEVGEYVTTDGRQFCAFTYRQLQELTGWDAHRVKRALAALCPCLRLLEAGVRGRPSAYVYEGVQPIAAQFTGENTGHMAVNREPQLTGENSQFAGKNRELTGENSELTGENGVVEMPANPDAFAGENFEDASANADENTVVRRCFSPVNVGEIAASGDASTRSTSSTGLTRSTSTLSYAREGGRKSAPGLERAFMYKKYKDFLKAFGRGAGNRDADTFEAFIDRVSAGYGPDAIAAGAGVYRAKTPDQLASAGLAGEKKKYPLLFLETDAHFCAYVARAKDPKLIEAFKKAAAKALAEA